MGLDFNQNCLMLPKKWCVSWRKYNGKNSEYFLQLTRSTKDFVELQNYILIATLWSSNPVTGAHKRQLQQETNENWYVPVPAILLEIH